MPRVEVDGLQISYDDVGGGDPALLCLTGWCSNRARYSQLVPLLAREHRVLALDWRGHGESDASDVDFGEDELVADALAVIEAAGVERFVPVSASHAGWIAIELRRRLGQDRVPKLVNIDWMIVEPPPPFLAAVTALQATDSWAEVRDTLLTMWQAGVETPEVRSVAEVMRKQDGDMWRRSGREVLRAYQRSVSPLRAYQGMDPVPRVLHLYGQPEDPAYLHKQQEFAATHQWFEVSKLAARTHFPMVETASEIAAAIEEFVAAR